MSLKVSIECGLMALMFPVAFSPFTLDAIADRIAEEFAASRAGGVENYCKIF